MTYKNLKSYLPVIIVGAVIFIVSHQSKIDAAYTFGLSDKLLHIGAYLIFGLALIWGMNKNHPDIKIERFFLIFLLIGSTFALSDEVHQNFVAGRDSDFFDWLADNIGLIIAFWIFKYLKQRKIISKKSENPL